MNEKLIDALPNQIYFVRGQKVMVDSDLALLYDVETKQLKRKVRRNINRFPENFMFELTEEESNSLRDQFGTLKQEYNAKSLPMVFTGQGVAMLSYVLNSKIAIQISIQIVRMFVRIRQMRFDSAELKFEMERIKQELRYQGKDIEIVFQYLDDMLLEKI